MVDRLRVRELKNVLVDVYLLKVGLDLSRGRVTDTTLLLY